MVNFVKDESKFSAKGDVDMELKELKDFSIPSPSFLRRKSSPSSEMDVEGGLRTPPSSFKFPSPPSFLANPLGEEEISLMRATNVKVKLILFIASLALLAHVGFGVVNVTIFLHNQSFKDSSEEFAWSELETKVEVSLEALDELKFILKNFTSSPKNLLTRNTTRRKISSWGGRPKFAWAP